MQSVWQSIISMHSLWKDAILLIALAPLAYYITATIAALRFLRRTSGNGDGVGAASAAAAKNFMPPVSLLKPVHGVDFGSIENFESFCRQDYLDYEILFAVNDESDSAVPLIRDVAARFPERKIRLISGAPQIGANKKVNNLIELLRAARHEIIVLTDGDVRVLPNFLREVVAPFADPKTGAVTSFYRGISQKSLGAELEAIGAASDFFAGVLVAEWMEGMTFALGASIVTTKNWVAKIGGFEAIADMHSDDYELGHRIAKAGGKVELSRELVWTMYPAQSARSFWNHQVRWSRTVRLCRPLSFMGLILTHGLPWAIGAALVAPTKSIAVAYLAAYLILRLVMAWTVGVRVAGDEIVRRKLWLIPFRDAIHFVVWLASLASNKISWGGEEFTMREGRMTPLPRS
jgi:ceramide glucosyltransferase